MTGCVVTLTMLIFSGLDPALDNVVNDREFVAEVGPWGWAVTVVAMLAIFVSRLAGGTDAVQSAGYTFFALLVIPIVWLASGRYASYWFSKVSGKPRVRLLFVAFWILLTVKLFFLGWPESASVVGTIVAAVGALFAGYAASRSFARVVTGRIEPLSDPTVRPLWLLHPTLIVVFTIFLLV